MGRFSTTNKRCVAKRNKAVLLGAATRGHAPSDEIMVRMTPELRAVIERSTGRPSAAAGSGGLASGQETRFGLQPFADYASALLTIDRPCDGKDVVGDFVRLDAERVLNDLGSPIAVVGVDGLFQQVTHLRHSSSRLPEAIKERHSVLLALMPALDHAIFKRECEPKHRTGFNLIDPLTGLDKLNRRGRPRRVIEVGSDEAADP